MGAAAGGGLIKGSVVCVAMETAPGPGGLGPGRASARDCGRPRSLYKVWACVVVRAKAKLEGGEANIIQKLGGTHFWNANAHVKQGEVVFAPCALHFQARFRCAAISHTQGPACPLCAGRGVVAGVSMRGLWGRCLATTLAKALEQQHQRATCPRHSAIITCSSSQPTHPNPHNHRETVY